MDHARSFDLLQSPTVAPAWPEHFCDRGSEAEPPLHPEKVKYYLERRDPEFESKMREVLLVYQEVALQNQNGSMIPMIITVSVDEKPGVQAIANTAPCVSISVI